ncbi:hypothetical protein ACFL6U_23435 [Planctomycetota bacterium]
MIDGKKIKIRFKRYFKKQKLWFFVGDVQDFSENWVEVHGKGILFDTTKMKVISIDSEPITLVCPYHNIAHIRILPGDFDFSQIETYPKDDRWFFKVEGEPDASLGEND